MNELLKYFTLVWFASINQPERIRERVLELIAC